MASHLDSVLLAEIKDGLCSVKLDRRALVILLGIAECLNCIKNVLRLQLVFRCY